MEPVRDAAQLNMLIADAKNKCDASNINCYMMSDEIRRVCAESRLYYEEIEAGLLIYLENDRVFQMSLYVNPQIPLKINHTQKPLTAAFIGMNTPSVKTSQAIEALINAGFSHNASAKRMSMNLDYNHLVKAPDTVGVITADRNHVRQIMTLWEDTFEPVSNDLPDEGELLKLIDAGNIICVQDGKEIVGALQMEFSGHTALSRHYAVAPECRGKNIGKALTAEYHRRATEKDVRILYLWVATEPAANFHAHFGYLRDGRVFEQYLLI